MISGTSIFGQIISVLNSANVSFDSLVVKFGNDRNAKGFTSRQQFISMLFSHLARADSLREITNGLDCCTGKILHLGIDSAPKRSTLAYANEHRSYKLYEAYFWRLLDCFRATRMLGGGQGRFRFRNKLYSLDSTTISLCLSLFPWADYRREKGGIKVHVLLDHADYMPSFACVTDAKTGDSKIAPKVPLRPGSIVAADRGYIDFAQFRVWDKAGIFFVTRMKDNIKYIVSVPQRCGLPVNVTSDDEIYLTGTDTKKKYPKRMRLVTVWNEEKQETVRFLTNNFRLSSETIARIYKERWQIEIFFKTIKQTLNIKTFVGTSENALLIQIWTAMTAMMILKWLHWLSKAKWSLSVMSSLLRLNLFTYRPLLEWLHDPYRTPPAEPAYAQTSLFDM